MHPRGIAPVCHFVTNLCLCLRRVAPFPVDYALGGCVGAYALGAYVGAYALGGWGNTWHAPCESASTLRARLLEAHVGRNDAPACSDGCMSAMRAEGARSRVKALGPDQWVRLGMVE